MKTIIITSTAAIGSLTFFGACIYSALFMQDPGNIPLGMFAAGCVVAALGFGNIK